jgi:hypothetical protein
MFALFNKYCLCCSMTVICVVQHLVSKDTELSDRAVRMVYGGDGDRDVLIPSDDNSLQKQLTTKVQSLQTELTAVKRQLKRKHSELLQVRIPNTPSCIVIPNTPLLYCNP